MSIEKNDSTVPNQGKMDLSFRNDRYITAITVALLIIMISALSLGYVIWDNYGNQIIDNQKEQLLLTSHTLANNIEMALEEYQSDLRFLYSQWKESGSFEETTGFFREYLETKSSMETDIMLISPDTIKSVAGTEITEQQQVTKISDTMTVWLASDSRGRHLFIFRESSSEEGDLSLAVDADRCYEKWISGIKIGTSGYIMVKNSSGIILMHPQQSQWGIHVISGRKEMYPDLDLESLENMVDTQNQGGEGVSDYYSYWWMKSPLPRVRKFSGYSAAQLGNDFWVISSVVDYDDFNAPIEKGFARIAILFTGSFVAAAGLLLMVNRLLVDRRRSRQEIATLRALNERLEEVHRGEERIGHQQRLQVIGTMTGGIAHEFNNLLTPIMGYSELLMMDLPEDSEAYDNALEIYDASEKAKDVVRQISTLSRRNVETVFKNKEALPLLNRSCKMMKSICPNSIHLEEDFAIPDDSVLLCNTTQINQVLLNLCVNSIYAIRLKELEIDSRKDIGLQKKAETSGAFTENASETIPYEGRILIWARIISRSLLDKTPLLENREVPEDWENYLQIRVCDNGIGMNADILRQVFTPFFTTKKAGEGTGLGLALAEQIVLSHRGYIYAESTPGKGSVFTVCLPLIDTKKEVREYNPRPASSKRIVIADDNPKILDMLSKNFSKLEVEADTCRTREKLRRLLESKKVDVLLIDDSLEDGTAIDFCMSIQGKYPSLIKIVMADYPTLTLIEAKQRKIIDGYLLKPVSHIDAIEEIHRCSKTSEGVY